MKFITSLLVVLISTSAFAHFKIGTYKGTSLTGEACQFEILNVKFKNKLKHPLNERVSIKIGNYKKAITMTHLPQVDLVNLKVRPKKGVLSAVKATKSGAQAVELVMNEEGPVHLSFITDNYKDKTQSQRYTCQNLVFQEEN